MAERLLWFLTGGAIPILLIATGIFFLIYLRGLPLRSPRRMFRAMTAPRPHSGISPFRAVTLALAGTLGVGNIVGVANAIWIGGAGAIFWMWISALAAMLLKYAEITLAVRHRRVAPDGSFRGGAVYYIRDLFAARSLPRVGAILSAFFACLMILDAISMGCVIQVNAVGSALEGVLGIPTWLCGIFLVLATVPVITRTSKAVSALTEYFVPIMSGGYLILSLAVLCLRAGALPQAFASILFDAFRPQSAAGGLFGFLTGRALRTGTMRGLLSNEAGCGTAPTAHASADASSPAAQGVWGIFEVFADTILLCTVTALVILVSYPDVEALGENAVMMTIRAYSVVLGGWSERFLCAAVLCFGYATVICWSGYGAESLRALTGNKQWHRLYLCAFAVFLFVGCILAPGAVWTVSDLAITGLTTVNLAVLIALRREVREETARTFKRPPSGRKSPPRWRRHTPQLPATSKVPSAGTEDAGSE